MLKLRPLSQVRKWGASRRPSFADYMQRHPPPMRGMAMFDYVEAMWQPPSEAEMAAMDGVRIG